MLKQWSLQTPEYSTFTREKRMLTSLRLFFRVSVCLRMYQVGAPLDGFSWSLIPQTKKFSEKIKFYCKSDRNIRDFSEIWYCRQVFGRKSNSIANRTNIRDFREIWYCRQMFLGGNQIRLPIGQKNQGFSWNLILQTKSFGRKSNSITKWDRNIRDFREIWYWRKSNSIAVGQKYQVLFMKI